MTNLRSYLKTDVEQMPSWIENFHSASTFSIVDFFDHRIVFYPGSGHDGHAVELFAESHCAHTFIYADYMLGEKEITNQIDDEKNGFKGYRTIVRKQLQMHDLTPQGWVPHMPPVQYNDWVKMAAPYGFLEILEREEKFDANHGAKRIAILFLGADAIATFDALFCQRRNRGPFAILLQDHGFGGGYTSYGEQGNLRKLARKFNIKPTYLLTALNTAVWNGYEAVKDLAGNKVEGSRNRFLYATTKNDHAIQTRTNRSYIHLF